MLQGKGDLMPQLTSEQEIILAMMPNCKVVSTISQEENVRAWEAIRNNGIGGSDVGAICGVSPFSSARQIYLNKTKQYDESMDGPKFSDAALERMKWGHILEPIVADEYFRVAREEHDIVSIHDLDVTVAHKDYPWCRANVDRITLHGDKSLGVVECKTTGEYNNDEWANGNILLSYIYQIQWYLFVTGLQKGAFACLVGGNKFYYYYVHRDDELIAEIFEKAKHFWFENVQKLVEPPLQHTDEEFISQLYPEAEKNSEMFFEAEEEETVSSLAAEIVALKIEIKELEGQVKEKQNIIKEKLGSTEIGYTSDYVVKWSTRVAKRVSTDMLRTKYPDVYKDVLNTSSYRAFTIKVLGGTLDD